MSSSLQNSSYYQSLPTAGAIAVTNEKGDRTMQKVKVQRYVTGRVPNYVTDKAVDSSSSSSSEDESNEANWSASRGGHTLLGNNSRDADDEDVKPIVYDRRFQRLMQRKELKELDVEVGEEVRPMRTGRHVQQPQVLLIGDSEAQEERHRRQRSRRDQEMDSSDDNDNDNADEDNVERRHAVLRLKREDEDEELLEKDDDEENEEEDESEYEEYTDSDEDNGPRLKPVFVKKRDRITIHEKEKEELKQLQEKEGLKKVLDERRRQTLKIIENDVRREEAEKEEANEEEEIRKGIAAVATDDESEETAYEIWKLRELKRIKRNKDEYEAEVREKLEVEKLRNMTEEERLLELKNNPKVVTNAAEKGKYKFLQKYYHRGAFYLDEEDEVFKRDFAQPTLEDHFDRTVVPKVMQVKNFGRSGRTKYTHLVDQDTTAFDSPWSSESAVTLKFKTTQAGGMKQVFDRPSGKRK